MSLHLEFEPHSWYMGFAIKKDNNSNSSWNAYTADGMSGYIIEKTGFATLEGLKQEIREYHLEEHTGYGERLAKRRLEYLRGEIKAERISYGEIAELQSLTDYIEDGDIELLQWAGIEEGTR